MADFDAIVVGSGISGGWVAKELCERGLKVCVLERGKPTDPSRDYSDFLEPWEKPHFDSVSEQILKRDFFIQGRTYALKESTRRFWMTDREQPYEVVNGQKFKWRRGAHVGGRSLMWGRAVYRLSPADFEENKLDGEGVDWPVRYDDIAPWYDHVEKFIGVAGNRDGLSGLPDGKHFLPAFEHTCVETELKTKLEAQYPGRHLIMGRVAHLTHLSDEQIALGRGKCQARNHCYHGCSYGAYFSSVSATLPAAKRTGNLTLIPNAVVSQIVHNPATNRVTGVKVIDTQTGGKTTYTARIVFLNASTIGTSLILLNSASEAQPNGLANSSDQVGRNLMDHLGGTRVTATVRGFQDKYTFGRRPIGAYIPRYRNYGERKEDYKRGWGYQVYSGRGGWGGWHSGIGEAFKAKNRTPGDWSITLDAFGECLPNPNNRVTAHATKTDKWGQPTAVIDIKLGENDKALMRAAHQDAIEMLTSAGFENIREGQKPEDNMDGIGGRIHEMGTARMGHDPKTSVLNGWNQSHDTPNLFITDGSFMASSAVQNPSLTYMAFSARAANHAADLLQEGVL
jgi:choline dehydrogenase-like flavoprotein